MMEISQPYMGHSTRSCCGCCGHVCDRTLFMREKYNLAGGRKFFCVFKIGSSIQLELDM